MLAYLTDDVVWRPVSTFLSEEHVHIFRSYGLTTTYHIILDYKITFSINNLKTSATSLLSVAVAVSVVKIFKSTDDLIISTMMQVIISLMLFVLFTNVH